MAYKNCLIIFALILIISIIIYYSFDTSYIEIEIDEPNSKAKCMDGSNYKFLFSKGFGNGTNSFYIYFEGGGFCGDNNYNPKDNNAPLKSCLIRKDTALGSNKFDIKYRYFHKFFSRLLSSSNILIPYFIIGIKYLLNIVMVHYI